MSKTKIQFLLRMGDSALILGQRLSEWCGHGPALEEDIATTNVALDLIGQAQYWLDYAGELEGEGRDADQLAYFRAPEQFRNLVLVEQPNGDFGDTIIRQFFYDVWHYQVLAGLCESGDERIREIAQKSIKEVSYHVKRSSDWVLRLGDGTEESHRRVQKAADFLWDFVAEMFTGDDAERALAAEGDIVDLSALRKHWQIHIESVFADATLELPSGPEQRFGMARNQHSEHLSYLLAEMQSLRRAHPDAHW